MSNTQFQVELARYKYWLSTNPPMSEVPAKSQQMLNLTKPCNGQTKKRSFSSIR